ncbi:MAG: hypothetical protein R6X16_04970 [Anaerolineae bacterium]
MSAKHLKALALILLVAILLHGAAAMRGALAQAPEGVLSERPEGTGPSVQVHHVTLEELPGVQAAGVTPLYHFAGVLNDSVKERGTVVFCTNLDAVTQATVEVQLYNWDATHVDTGSIFVGPLETATFESTTINFYMADVAMNAGLVEQGYGRILTSHSNVVCTVQVLDADGSPPAWSMDIPLYRQGFGLFLPTVLKSETP